jgi:ABC-2 type transport system ATP-binding protein
MPAVSVQGVSKSYGGKMVVEDVSLRLERGMMLGLIGPNGAGKTTTIRMIMNITQPDSGVVEILGRPWSAETTRLLGYLPEERGLYRKLRVIDCITSLIGMEAREAERRADELLERTGMLPHRGKRVEALSKGMGQIVQFIVAVLHDPEVVILDEPFANLDPVNTELLKEMLRVQRAQGKAVILSTHGMNDVEELCDSVVMINGGRVILHGGLEEVKSRYSKSSVLLEAEGEIGELPGVREMRRAGKGLELVLADGASPQKILETLVARKAAVSRFQTASPSMTEIFIKALEEQG